MAVNFCTMPTHTTSGILFSKVDITASFQKFKLYIYLYKKITNSDSLSINSSNSLSSFCSHLNKIIHIRLSTLPSKKCKKKKKNPRKNQQILLLMWYLVLFISFFNHCLEKNL